MRAFWLALQFLTIVRGPQSVFFPDEDFKSSLRWFFLIGLLIGGLQWIFLWCGLKYQIPGALLSPLVLGLGVLLTGGLHLDGVADTADGFGAGIDRESALRIMKDSRTGVYGITAIFLTLYLKIQAYSFVMQSQNLVMLLIAPMLSRALLAGTCTILPYARTDGTGKAFSGGSFAKHALPSLVLASAVTAYAMQQRTIYVLGPVFAVTFFLCLYCYAKIKGFTGDTLGTQNEITEITALLAGGLLF